MQHVAPRSARVVFVGGGGGNAGGEAGGAGHGDNATRRAAAATRAASPTPPPAVFSALGAVGGGGGRGLEKLAKQEVAYVGKQLRIGRTRGGDVYVYERCAWPEELEDGLVV